MKKGTLFLLIALAVAMAVPTAAGCSIESAAPVSPLATEFAVMSSEPWYDMRYYEGDLIPEEINGAIWLPLPSTDATGSGVFNAFFRIQAGPQEMGYNTDGRPLQFDDSALLP